MENKELSKNDLNLIALVEYYAIEAVHYYYYYICKIKCI